MTDLYAVLVAQRLALCDLLNDLDERQWATPSLCCGWTVRDVVCHLLGPVEFSVLRSVLPLIRSRFNFSRYTNLMVSQDARDGPTLGAALRKGARVRWTPPGFGFEAPLTDVLVHGSDCFVALGISRPIDLVAARAVLDFLVTPKAGRAFTSRDRVAAMRWEATDLNWAFGEGEVVRGTCEQLMLTMTGRDFGSVS